MSISIIWSIVIDVKKRLQKDEDGIEILKDKLTEESKDNYNLTELARSFEDKGDYEKASLFYLKSGQIYASLKMKAMLGPKHSKEIISILKNSDVDNPELILRNLVNEVYYKHERPAMAVSLLNDYGLKEDAEALGVASGISNIVTENMVDKIELKEELVDEDLDLNKEEQKILNLEVRYENIMQTATVDMSEKCYLCKKSIEENKSYIQCIYCGIYGHYSHFGEYMKVKVNCPSCSKRLTQSMYNLYTL